MIRQCPVPRARCPVPRALGTGHWALGTALLVLASPLSAQTRLADSLWAAEDYGAARIEYTRVLNRDPGSVRALYRLAILTSWEGKLDSALALLRDAREVEPSEPDVRLWEARVLAWRGRYRQALARYDSLIVEFPERSDARLGRAQTLAWAGRQREADAEYRTLVAGDPGYAEALFGLAQLRLWQERLEEADHYNNLALHVAPQNPASRELKSQIGALRNPRLDLTVGASHDSDRNDSWWQSIATSVVMGPGLRLIGGASAFETKDPLRRGTRLAAEAGVGWNHADFGVNGAIGVSRLTSSLGSDRTIGAVRLAARYRLGPSAGIGAGYSRYSFDETALLLARRLNVREFSADGDVNVRPSLNLSFGLGAAYYSDNNHRTALVAAVSQQVATRFTFGVFGRRLWYDFRGSGYFSPDRFLLGEVRGTYSGAIAGLGARLSGGVGFQQAGRGVSTEAEWHMDLRLARRWSTINEIALSAGLSNSSISSASGAFHYYMAAVSARIGL